MLCKNCKLCATAKFGYSSCKIGRTRNYSSGNGFYCNLTKFDADMAAKRVKKGREK